jgi:prefoldin alpha subunit
MSTPAGQQEQVREALEAGEALQGHLQGIEEQLAYLNALQQEYQRSRAALEALAKASKGDELLLSIGGGNFVRATLAEQDNVISGIGSGVSVEGRVEDALRRVDQQLAAARDASARLQEEGQRTLAQMQALEQRLQGLQG